MRSWKRLLPAGAAWLVLAASAEAQETGLPAWATADAAARVVELRLEAAGDTAATLNGHHHGSAQLVVPFGWTVKWEWANRDSTLRHSLVVMAEREKIPPEGGRPAIDNAMSRAVTSGLAPGQRDLTTFIADPAGWYWMLCGVPGHAIRGEWIGLKVDREATGVSVRLRP
ncbi:MAG: sulfocyanin-like copper-binding protein [Gemmatimonadota bacterium]|nr:sulfocyanin-like copper-binding protein [Gemmatimonadota bacterium]